MNGFKEKVIMYANLAPCWPVDAFDLYHYGELNVEFCISSRQQNHSLTCWSCEKAEKPTVKRQNPVEFPITHVSSKFRNILGHCENKELTYFQLISIWKLVTSKRLRLLIAHVRQFLQALKHYKGAIVSSF